MTSIYHTKLYSRFLEIKSKFQRKKLYRTNHGFNFLGGGLRNGGSVRPPIQLVKKDSLSILKDEFYLLKNRYIHFRINSTIVIRPVKQNKLSFASIEISKPLPGPVYSVSQLRFKFRSQLQLLPYIRCLITLEVESSITSINITVPVNIIRKVVDVFQEKCRTLRSTSVN